MLDLKILRQFQFQISFVKFVIRSKLKINSLISTAQWSDTRLISRDDCPDDLQINRVMRDKLKRIINVRVSFYKQFSIIEKYKLGPSAKMINCPI